MALIRNGRIAGAAVLALTLGGCDVLGPECLDFAAPALTVRLYDAATSELIPAGPGRIIARDGAFADTVEFEAGPFPGGLRGTLAHERVGTYTVDATVEGYAAFRREGVVVEEDACHVLTREVNAEMEPLDAT